MRFLTPLLAALALVLAGCSGGGGKAEEDPTAGLGLEPTATTGIIRGVVVDETITPVSKVAITIASLKRTVESNDVGAFGFEGLDPGTYFLSASKPGYKAVQQSAEVEAGVAEPKITKIQLAADPTTRPTFEVFHFQGYLECSALAGPFFQPCEVPFTDQHVGNDNYYTEFPLSGNASFIHVSMVWEATQAFGRNLYFNLFDGYDAYQVAEYNGGPSPLEGNANATALAETNINSQGYVAYEVATDGEAPADGVPGLAGASVKQGFDAYLVVFYGFVPPEGYAYHRDGDPKIPE